MINSNKTSSFNVRWFKEQIAKQGLSQRQIAQSMGINQSVISHMFAGTRKMSLVEAPRWAELLKVPLNEVLTNAGVPVPTGSVSATYASGEAPAGMELTVKGWVDGEHVVHWGAAKGPMNVSNPLWPAVGTAVLRFQTAGGPYDGALVYYQEVPGKAFDYDGIGKLCLVQVGERHMLRIPVRGYEPGRHNLTLFNGVLKEEGVVLESLMPILWMKL